MLLLKEACGGPRARARGTERLQGWGRRSRGREAGQGGKRRKDAASADVAGGGWELRLQDDVSGSSTTPNEASWAYGLCQGLLSSSLCGPGTRSLKQGRDQ